MIYLMNACELKSKMDKEDSLTVIDCREQDEWDTEHIEGALHLPLSSFEQGIEEIKNLKDRPIVLQCRSGRRSLRACKILSDKGFEELYNLEGGILSWIEQGYAVKTNDL